MKYLNFDIWKYFWKRIEQYYWPMRSMRWMRYWNKPLKKYIVFHQNKVQYIVYMMFLLVIGLIGLIGNSVSIVVLSKPDMYNCFNQLLITLSTMDSVFIILAMIDYSFNRYVPFFMYFLEDTKKYNTFSISICIYR